MVNVGKYPIHGSYGKERIEFWDAFFSASGIPDTL